MKTKLAVSVKIEPMPAIQDRYMVLSQYNSGGAIFTDSNGGKGYTASEASALGRKIIDSGKPTKD